MGCLGCHNCSIFAIINHAICYFMVLWAAVLTADFYVFKLQIALVTVALALIIYEMKHFRDLYICCITIFIHIVLAIPQSWIIPTMFVWISIIYLHYVLLIHVWLLAVVNSSIDGFLSLSVCLSVCLSPCVCVCVPVTPFLPCPYSWIFMKFTSDIALIKCLWPIQFQVKSSKVKVTGIIQNFVVSASWLHAYLAGLLYIWNKYVLFYSDSVSIRLNHFICGLHTTYDGTMCHEPFSGWKVKVTWVIRNFYGIHSVAPSLFHRFISYEIHTQPIWS